MKNYFENVSTLQELKKAYHKLCMMYHPDIKGGSLEIMQEINKQYDKLFPMLKNKQNTEAKTEKEKTTETPEQFKNILNVLLKLDGLIIEMCGAWLWISGNTYIYKDILKQNNCFWSKGKKKWFWNGDTEKYYPLYHKTMNQIRKDYGSKIFETEKQILIEK